MSVAAGLSVALVGRTGDFFEVEIFHFGGEGGGEGAGVEMRGRRDAGVAGDKVLPHGFNLMTKRSDPADACDDDALTHISPLRLRHFFENDRAVLPAQRGGENDGVFQRLIDFLLIDAESIDGVGGIHRGRNRLFFEGEGGGDDIERLRASAAIADAAAHGRDDGVGGSEDGVERLGVGFVPHGDAVARGNDQVDLAGLDAGAFHRFPEGDGRGFAGFIGLDDGERRAGR